MPFTFFVHQTVVLPLKWIRPKWFDGTALCVGSAVPDFAYALVGTPLEFHSHTAWAQLYYGLPLSLVLTALFRRVIAEPLSTQVSEPLAGELRVLAVGQRPLLLTIASALLGCFSHIFIDGFTHTGGWASSRIAFLQRVPFEFDGHGVSVANLLQYVGHVLGTLIGVWLFAMLVRRRKLAAWYGGEVEKRVQVSDAHFRKAFFWTAALATVAAVSVQVTGGGAPVAIIRAFWVIFFGLLVASMTGQRINRPYA